MTIAARVAELCKGAELAVMKLENNHVMTRNALRRPCEIQRRALCKIIGWMDALAVFCHHIERVTPIQFTEKFQGKLPTPKNLLPKPAAHARAG